MSQIQIQNLAVRRKPDYSVPIEQNPSKWPNKLRGPNNVNVEAIKQLSARMRQRTYICVDGEPVARLRPACPPEILFRPPENPSNPLLRIGDEDA
ncbi:MAG: hypothetical protein OXD01_00460 [Gammaproteobacteria bacterium]|nr:hypothetical protein [Gammaproteobacteria bacterium]